MADTADFKLPNSGLAEDILAQFMVKAQEEVNQESQQTASREGGEIVHLVTFHLGREEYGIDIGDVQEIIRATDITPVPGAPVHVKGVINLRGKIIPVVDLRRRFALPECTRTEAERIVVVEAGQKKLGMLVDSVSQVIKLPSTVIEEIPEEATTSQQNYIKGVGKLDGRMVIILDLNRSLLLA